MRWFAGRWGANRSSRPGTFMRTQGRWRGLEFTGSWKSEECGEAAEMSIAYIDRDGLESLRRAMAQPDVIARAPPENLARYGQVEDGNLFLDAHKFMARRDMAVSEPLIWR